MSVDGYGAGARARARESKVQRREKKGKKLLARIGGRVEGQDFAKKNPLGAPF